MDLKGDKQSSQKLKSIERLIPFQIQINLHLRILNLLGTRGKGCMLVWNPNQIQIVLVRSNYESDEMTSSIFDDPQNKSSHKTFQLHNKYIINTIKSGMLVIDQNRAHERILYEEFLRKTTVNEAVSQQLLFPLTAQIF